MGERTVSAAMATVGSTARYGLVGNDGNKIGESKDRRDHARRTDHDGRKDHYNGGQAYDDRRAHVNDRRVYNTRNNDPRILIHRRVNLDRILHLLHLLIKQQYHRHRARRILLQHNSLNHRRLLHHNRRPHRKRIMHHQPHDVQHLLPRPLLHDPPRLRRDSLHGAA